MSLPFLWFAWTESLKPPTESPKTDSQVQRNLPKPTIEFDATKATSNACQETLSSLLQMANLPQNAGIRVSQFTEGCIRASFIEKSNNLELLSLGRVTKDHSDDSWESGETEKFRALKKTIESNEEQKFRCRGLLLAATPVFPHGLEEAKQSPSKLLEFSREQEKNALALERAFPNVKSCSDPLTTLSWSLLTNSILFFQMMKITHTPSDNAIDLHKKAHRAFQLLQTCHADVRQQLRESQ